MLQAPVNAAKSQDGHAKRPQTPLPERERYPLSLEAPGHPSLTGNGNGSILPSAVARSRSAVGSLQHLYGNQAMLQMRNGLGGAPVPSVPLRPSQSGILQRKCACGDAAGMSGECEECSNKKKLGLQTKLKVNEPGDIYEQEADRIADQVTSTSVHTAANRAPPQIQRFSGQSNGQMDAAPASVDQVLASPGRPLEPALQQDMEQRFGHDFSGVRVHTDENAETSARMINAHAYTVGNDIVFGLGRFDSNATDGRHLLAHELTHVVQQSAGHAPRAVVRQPAKAPPKAPKCDTGLALRWGQDTTCSKWGFQQGVHEREPQFLIEVKNKKLKTTPCCNSWPFSVEEFARKHLGLSGAASCKVQHEREIATITLGDEVKEVLCSDTIPTDKSQVIEISPKAMQDLSGQVANPLQVSVCFSGSKQDLCLSNSLNPKSFPEVGNCLTDGCTPPKGTPKLVDTGWRRT